MEKKDWTFVWGMIFALILVWVLVFVCRFAVVEYLKIGFSVAIGWCLGKAMILPLASRLNKGIILLFDTVYWRYRQWKEED